jgi:hypothetical protein
MDGASNVICIVRNDSNAFIFFADLSMLSREAMMQSG